jgi:hypothetical protein
LGAVVGERFGGVAEVVAACVRRDMARGYNRLWRTELPQLPCAAAGSVVLLKAQHRISATEIIALQTKPIGERTGEGYGCFIIQEAADRLSIMPSSPSRPGEPPDGPPPVVEDLQRRLFGIELRRRLASRARRLAGSAVLAGISPSLLQRLRGPLREPGKWRDTYSIWFAERPAATQRCLPKDQKNKLEQVRVQSPEQTLLQLLAQACQHGWPPLGRAASEVPAELRVVPQSRANALWQDGARQLAAYFLDTLLSLLAKRAKPARDDQGGHDNDPQG